MILSARFRLALILAVTLADWAIRFSLQLQPAPLFVFHGPTAGLYSDGGGIVAIVGGSVNGCSVNR